MSSEITHIIADVGGVLIKNYDHTQDVRRAVGLDGDVFDPIWKREIAKYGTGGDETTLWQAFQEVGGRYIPADGALFRDQFEANLDIYTKVINFLGRSGCQLSILSNTIAPHVEVLERHGVYNLFAGHVYLSNEIGLSKPSPEAYEYALEQLGQPSAENVLFIDDREENLVVPRAMNMRTLLANGGEDEIIASLTSLFSSVKY